jgi:aconitate hydratase
MTHTLRVGQKSYTYYPLDKAGLKGDLKNLPYTLRVLLENVLRKSPNVAADVAAFDAWLRDKTSTHELAYSPARVLMQDFTGVPAVVDLAAMRDALKTLGGDPETINPLCPVDLVIDHSVMIDHFGTPDAFQKNVDLEFERNGERYSFLRWGQTAFRNFRVVPPGTGICHQVNLEYLAQVVFVDNETQTVYPDTVVGTDSHTTMVNGLSVLGWGVGGIEAEAAMLGQPVSMVIPEVVGFELTGTLPEGATATDLVLTVTHLLRKKGVVGKFVEFYGAGLSQLSLADRATLANMAPEYGATCGFFAIDEETLRYLTMTGRSVEQIALVEGYAKDQNLWRDDAHVPVYTDTLRLDLATLQPALAGPKRPQDLLPLSQVSSQFHATDFAALSGRTTQISVPLAGSPEPLSDGAVVIAAITSCTNTSNPAVMLAAGLVAKKARALGLTRKPWVKTSLAPGSQVVTDYLAKANLQGDLDALGFALAGYGCTTCIGNSGPLPEAVEAAIKKDDLLVGAVLSGNRNFEGRIHPLVKANYLASPPLVVAYALMGTLTKDLKTEPLGTVNGRDIFLRDIWPTNAEIAEIMARCVTPEMFEARYGRVFEGSPEWQRVKAPTGTTYAWDHNSTYIQNPPYFVGMTMKTQPLADIRGARPLAILGDSVTTDHISPAGNIKESTPAGLYLKQAGVAPQDFNSYGARRGNHEVMMRGTFANIRLQNAMRPETQGGVTKIMPAGQDATIYDAGMHYQAQGTPLIIVAGKEYGTGSSRDWAAKGTRLLGVKAVIAESFERIHRSNLIGMGVLALEFMNGDSAKSLSLRGDETFDLTGVATLRPRAHITLTLHRADGTTTTTQVLARIDTDEEMAYFVNDGILSYVLRQLAGNR